MTKPKPNCPNCGSDKVYSNGKRQRRYGPAQTYLCKQCGGRFSENYLKLPQQHSAAQISAIECAKNLDNPTQEKPRKIPVSGDVETNLKNLALDINGKKAEYLAHLELQGYATSTQKLNATCLKVLIDRGANLANPESIKRILLSQSNKETAFDKKPWSTARKRNMINAYTQFLAYCGYNWEPPKNVVTRKLPFIPTIQEVMELASTCSAPIATFLLLMFYTAMRAGEAIQVEWKDVDFERRIIYCNHPEKGSNPRIFANVNRELLKMLDAMPRINDRVFGTANNEGLKASFCRYRRKLAEMIGNPRLKQIHFHTMRHFRATLEYHRTKDIMHVMEFLGHKEIRNTVLYITLEKQLFRTVQDNYVSRIALSAADACKLVDVGFEYVTGEYNDGGKIFRRMKTEEEMATATQDYATAAGKIEVQEWKQDNDAKSK